VIFILSQLSLERMAKSNFDLLSGRGLVLQLKSNRSYCEGGLDNLIQFPSGKIVVQAQLGHHEI